MTDKSIERRTACGGPPAASIQHPPVLVWFVCHFPTQRNNNGRYSVWQTNRKSWFSRKKWFPASSALLIIRSPLPPASSCFLPLPPASSCLLLLPPASSCFLLLPPASHLCLHLSAEGSLPSSVANSLKTSCLSTSSSGLHPGFFSFALQLCAADSPPPPPRHHIFRVQVEGFVSKFCSEEEKWGCRK